jgi:flavin-dependent dehydrogenase
VCRLTSGERWFCRGFAIEGVIPYAAIAAEPPMELLFNFVEDGYGWLFPKGDHVNVGIYTRSDSVPLSKQRLLAYTRYRLGCDKVEDIKGFPLGFGGAGYRLRHPRIVLAGDAGGFAEPLLGEGIHNAIKTGQAAADAITDVEPGVARSL